MADDWNNISHCWSGKQREAGEENRMIYVLMN